MPIIFGSSLSQANFFHGRKKPLLLSVVIGMVFLLATASPSVVLSAHALAGNFYEMGYGLQYCPFFLCGDYEYFFGASGTLSAYGPVPALTDTYNWAISLDNHDNNMHTWFQAGVITGLGTDNNFYSLPTFYIEYQTPTSYTFRTFGSVASNTNHNIAVYAGSPPILGGSTDGNNVQAWLDGSLIYDAPDCCLGQSWVPSAFLEVHQAGNNYEIGITGSWSNLLWWGGNGGAFCGGYPWGHWFCGGSWPTNSNTFAFPNPPTPYYIVYVSQTNFRAGGDGSGGGGGCCYKYS